MTKAREPDDPRLDLVNDPLDYLILDPLPLEGTLIFGAYHDGKSAKEIQPSVGTGEVSTGTIGARLGTLQHIGWVVKQKGIGTGGKHIWQRTPAGDKALREWKEGHGGDSA